MKTMHCRICDKEEEPLSFDGCCTECVEASEDVFNSDEIITVIPYEDEIIIEGDGFESLSIDC